MITVVEELQLSADCFKAEAGTPTRDGRAWVLASAVARGDGGPSDRIVCTVPERVLRAGDELLSIQVRSESEDIASALVLEVIDAGDTIARGPAVRPAPVGRLIRGSVVLRVSPTQLYGHRAIGVLVRRARPQ